MRVLTRVWTPRNSLSIFIPTIAIWAVIDIPPYPWFGGQSVLYTMIQWSTLGLLDGTSNPIFPFTLATAIVSFLLALAWLSEAGLGKIRSLLLAISFPFAFTSSFELVWQNAFLIVRPGPFKGTLLADVLFGSWLLLGLSTIGYWQITRKFYIALISLMAGFGGWFAAGYPQIFIPSELWLAFPLNIATKILFASVFLVLLYDGTSKQRTDYNASLNGEFTANSNLTGKR